MTSKAQIEKKIERVSKNGQAFDALVIETANDCIGHAEKHGDLTLLTKLRDALPKSYKVGTFQKIIMEVNPIKIDKASNAFAKSKSSDKEWTQVTIEDYREALEAAKAESTTDIDVLATVKALVERVNKAKASKSRKIKNAAILKELENLIAK